MRRARRLRFVAAISAAYDLLVGAAVLLATDRIAALFGVPPPVPPIHAELNGLFLLAVGLGYFLPLRDPLRYTGYLWIMGPFLKGGGALLFLLDAVFRDSPASFLLFSASDGSLALLTLWALLTPQTRDDRDRNQP